MTALSIHNFQPKIDGTLANYVDSSAIVPVYIWLLYESPENRPEEIDMDADIQQITIVIETLGGNALETNNDDWTFATIRAEIPGTKLRELAKIEQITHIRLD